ncbi:MAG: UDP-galactopyranose mutase, partial [Ignavibacteria bacterium]
YQFMPKNGYTSMFNKMLRNKNIDIILNTDYKSILTDVKFDKMIYTGPVDSFFDYESGRLPYISLRFDYEHYEMETYQKAAQINYVDSDVNFTRIVEYKKLTGQVAGTTTISREYSITEGEPYYPIPTESNHALFLKYQRKVERLKNIKFCGRLAEYQYYNMDQVVAKVLSDSLL